MTINVLANDVHRTFRAPATANYNTLKVKIYFYRNLFFIFFYFRVIYIIFECGMGIGRGSMGVIIQRHGKGKERLIRLHSWGKCVFK